MSIPEDPVFATWYNLILKKNFFEGKVGLPLNTFDMNFVGIIYSKYVVRAWLL
jgi:hypothetical protein